jgi:hypothetical protein
MPFGVLGWAMNFGVLPLRAIAFQTIFLMLAIALEAIVFFWQLNLDYRTSIRYTATLNLLSTVVGWLFFFITQALLPEGLRIQLISYFFFERFFPNPWAPGIMPILVVSGLGIFFGVFLLEFLGLDLLERILEKKKPADAAKKEEAKPEKDSGKDSDSDSKPKEKPQRFRRRAEGYVFKSDNRAYVVLVANSLSFSVILLFLFIRWLAQYTSA